jgi:hypothetical protein
MENRGTFTVTILHTVVYTIPSLKNLSTVENVELVDVVVMWLYPTTKYMLERISLVRGKIMTLLFLLHPNISYLEHM